ncbi:hypothetical protein [Paenibacillus sp. JJ-100]|nr:hypothetical protein [Paenibacillus sp. JJ-100]
MQPWADEMPELTRPVTKPRGTLVNREGSILDTDHIQQFLC